MSTDRLKLRAEDEEDLVVLSSLLQDALVPLDEIAYVAEERRFVLVASRFAWDRCPGGAGDGADRHFYRSHFGLTFEGVTAVKSRGIDLGARDRILELLAVKREEGEIELVFAGEVAIRLRSDRILAHGQDLGEPWPTPWRPIHPGIDFA